MLRNYLKIAWRTLLKSKMYSLINVVGLAAGMCVALLIGLWIWDEISFDRYHSKYDQLAQVMVSETYNGETGTWPSVVVPLGNALRNDYANDFKQVALVWNSSNILSVGEKKILQNGMWAEAGLPNMLALKMLNGSYEGFRDPSSVLLSESLAQVLFGNSDPVNQLLKIDDRISVKVAGVYEDLPRNTTLHETKYLLPWENKMNGWNTQTGEWTNHGCNLYVEVNKGVNFDKVTAKISNLIQPHLTTGKEEVLLHPMSKWRLYSEFKNGKVAGGRIQFVWLFGLVGIFVLLLACINFMNLSTARSGKRAKEIGIRKTIGSMRQQLVAQFLSESVLVASLSLLLSILFVQLLLPSFNSMADKKIEILWLNPVFWLLILGFTLFIGLISGSYPAFYLSSFDPIKVLKGTFQIGKAVSIPRRILVVVQFTVSVTLIIGTIIVFQQVHVAKNRPVGYTRQGLISVSLNTSQLNKSYNAIRQELLQTGVIEDMSASNSSSTEIWSRNTGFNWSGKDPDATPEFGTIAVTHDFGKTVNWRIMSGRDFSRDFSTDSGAFIINEAAVKLTGIENPIGKLMSWEGKEHPVVGVVRDMIMESPYRPMVPTIFYMDYGNTNLLTIRIKPAVAVRDALARMEPILKRYNSNNPFDYKFVDEEYARKYSDEERIGHLTTFFSVLAIFISCLGLFGLASFVSEQRAKEIGVRKVLGASTFNLWKMLSIDFIKLVIISCFISIPIAWYFLHKWLLQYEYRTNIAWWVFLVAGTGALLIALLTVSYQTIKAALMNPVKTLKSE